MKNLNLKSVQIAALLIISNLCITAWAFSNELPDLAGYPGIQIAGKQANWGEKIKIHAQDADYSKDGKCVFRYDLGLVNVGSAPTGEFGYRINSSGWSTSQTHPGVKAYEQTFAIGEIELKPGKQKLVIKLDNNEQITESDEFNNIPFALQIDVKGKCNSENNSESIIATK
ncbi:MAG: hypothetical protein AAF462_06580 [Thermodesulfobacteriota bacterium]